MAVPKCLSLSYKPITQLKSVMVLNKRESSDICEQPKKSEKRSVAKKVALVTGGASGIGLAIATEFLKNGIKGVTIADKDMDRGSATVINLQNKFGRKRVTFAHTDVSNYVDFDGAMRTTIDTFSNLDILVNNAGIMDDKRWETMIQINLNGVINGCILGMEKYIPKHKSRNSSGLILNVASIAGLEAIPAIPVYVATKHAVIGLGKCLSAPLHYNETRVRIVTICPGFFETPLTGNYFKGRTLTNRAEEQLEEDMLKPDFPMQKINFLAQSVMPIIDRATNGSIWIIDQNKVSQLLLPDIKHLKRLQTLSFD